MRYGTVAITGLGLIGGSIALALRRGGLAKRILALDPDPEALRTGRDRGVIDDGWVTWEAEGASALAEAEVVVVGAPVSRIVGTVSQIVAFGGDGLVTDVGSTKSAIVASLETNSSTAHRFVGSHPLAGLEQSGMMHARADLLDGRVVVLTPTERTDPDRVDQARRFWESLGARVLEMTPQDHDEALAWTSHVPHVVATALSGCIPIETLPYAAGAYRDGTRVAASETDLWIDILTQNRQAVLHALRSVQVRLHELADALESEQDSRLRDLWEQGRQRRRVYDRQQTPSSSPQRT